MDAIEERDIKVSSSSGHHRKRGKQPKNVPDAPLPSAMDESQLQQQSIDELLGEETRAEYLATNKELHDTLEALNQLELPQSSFHCLGPPVPPPMLSTENEFGIGQDPKMSRPLQQKPKNGKKKKRPSVDLPVTSKYLKEKFMPITQSKSLVDTSALARVLLSRQLHVPIGWSEGSQNTKVNPVSPLTRRQFAKPQSNELLLEDLPISSDSDESETVTQRQQQPAGNWRNPADIKSQQEAAKYAFKRPMLSYRQTLLDQVGRQHQSTFHSRKPTRPATAVPYVHVF